MAKYRKKPVVFDAIQWTELNFQEIEKFCKVSNFQNSESCARLTKVSDETEALVIYTEVGERICSFGNYVIKTLNGLNIKNKEEFEKNYEIVEE